MQGLILAWVRAEKASNEEKKWLIETPYTFLDTTIKHLYRQWHIEEYSLKAEAFNIFKKGCMEAYLDKPRLRKMDDVIFTVKFIQLQF